MLISTTQMEFDSNMHILSHMGSLTAQTHQPVMTLELRMVPDTIWLPLGKPIREIIVLYHSSRIFHFVSPSNKVVYF